MNAAIKVVDSKFGKVTDEMFPLAFLILSKEENDLAFS